MLDDVGAVRIIPDALQLPLRRRLLAGLGALPILLRGLDGVDLESLRLSLHFRGGGLSPLDGALCSSPNVSLAAEKDGVVWKWSDLPVKKRYTICSSWTIALLQCPPSRAADLSAPTMPLPKFVFPVPGPPASTGTILLQPSWTSSCSLWVCGRTILLLLLLLGPSCGRRAEMGRGRHQETLKRTTKTKQVKLLRRRPTAAWSRDRSRESSTAIA